MKEEFKIVVVASKYPKRCYEQLLGQFLRLVDILHKDNPDVKRFKIIHNGVKDGPLKDLFWVLDVVQPGLKSRGYFTQRELHKMDILLNGPASEAIWLRENAVNADAILVLDDKRIKQNVMDVVNDLDAFVMRVAV